MGVASWYMNPTTQDSLYIWTNLSKCILELGGRVAYMETHPKHPLP